MSNKKIILSGLVVIGGLILKKNIDDKKRKKLSELSLKFDQQDRDFNTEMQMRDAFRERSEGKNLSEADVLSAYRNISDNLAN